MAHQLWREIVESNYVAVALKAYSAIICLYIVLHVSAEDIIIQSG